MNELTVIIPAYNTAATLAAAVHSAQASGAVRVVVVDDGSEDDSASVGRAAGAEVLRKANGGVASARAHGLATVDTPLVATLDADDLLVPEGVAVLVDRAMREPAVAAVAGRVQVTRHGRTRPVNPSFTDATVQTLVRRGYAPWPPGAMVFRTALLRRTWAELGDPPRTEAEDYQLLLAMAGIAPIRWDPAVSLHYRESGGISALDPGQVIEDKERIRATAAALHGISYTPMSERERRTAAGLRTMRARQAEGDRAGALRLGLAVVVGDPRHLAVAVADRARLRWQTSTS